MSVAYTPWGDVLAYYGSGGIDFGYLGGMYDAGTGLLYMGNGRYYDPVTGRMLTRGAGQGKPGAFDPAGMMIAPLGLLGLVLGKKKKRGKWDSLLVLLVVGVVVGMSVSACTQQNQEGTDATATSLPMPQVRVYTWTPSSVPTGTATPVIVINISPTTTERPTEIPSDDCNKYLSIEGRQLKVPVFYDLPVKFDGRFYFGFGDNPFHPEESKVLGGHSGFDLSAEAGSDVIWTSRAKGQVISLGEHGAYPSVSIMTGELTDNLKKDLEKNLLVIFGHIDADVKLYDIIEEGTKIGTIHKLTTPSGADNSHLHLEVREKQGTQCFINPVYLFTPEIQTYLFDTFSEDYVTEFGDTDNERLKQEWYGRYCSW